MTATFILFPVKYSGPSYCLIIFTPFIIAVVVNHATVPVLSNHSLNSSIRTTDLVNLLFNDELSGVVWTYFDVLSLPSA